MFAIGIGDRRAGTVILDVDEFCRAIVLSGQEAKGDAASVAGFGGNREFAVRYVNRLVRHVVEACKTDRDGIGFGHDGKIPDIGHGRFLSW